MEPLSETIWDAVICGTGLKQSLLALSLSRSGKKILHIDPNEYYGGAEAAFSLNEADAWAARLAESQDHPGFRNASLIKPVVEATGLASPRQYALALAPHFVYSRSALVSQLVSSRAYRQVEFLAVGSFFVLQQQSDVSTLIRIPSTREDVFSTTAIPARSKRSLMKFLKFVLAEHEVASDASQAAPAVEPQNEDLATWQDKPLSDFLEQKFKLDADLRAYVLALTLSLDSNVSTRDGLAAVQRHVTSMGMFGPGFAAVYPKWGGLSEVAQVSCRAGAVGGGVYMLGTGIQSQDLTSEADSNHINLTLSNGETTRTKLLLSEQLTASAVASTISRMVAVVSSPLSSLFKASIEGAPQPAAVVVNIPAFSLSPTAGPIFLTVHSSHTCECPSGQSMVYLTTTSTPDSKEVLQEALTALLQSAAEDVQPEALYQLYYEQSATAPALTIQMPDAETVKLPTSSLSLAFNDQVLESVRTAWEACMGDASDAEFMTFEDREAVDDDEDEVYD